MVHYISNVGIWIPCSNRCSVERYIQRTNNTKPITRNLIMKSQKKFEITQIRELCLNAKTITLNDCQRCRIEYGLVRCCIKGCRCDWYPIPGNYEIIQIRRCSDGVLFSVGDSVQWGASLNPSTISSIELNPNGVDGVEIRWSGGGCICYIDTMINLMVKTEDDTNSFQILEVTKAGSVKRLSDGQIFKELDMVYYKGKRQQINEMKILTDLCNKSPKLFIYFSGDYTTGREILGELIHEDQLDKCAQTIQIGDKKYKLLELPNNP